ncbi:MAG: TolC family protein [Burkholderiaceae bacterium]|nr:TolC family protein [Burkholderiaceae bacterium]
MPFVFNLVGAALLSAGLFGGALAQVPSHLSPLTLDMALREAEIRSQTLVAQDAASRSAQDSAVAAGRLPDPTLRLSLDNLPIEGKNAFSMGAEAMTMRSVGFEQTFVSAEKRLARSARFERESDAALALRVLRLSELRQQTALAWFDQHYQQKMLDLLNQQREETSLQIESAETAYRSGRGMQTDVWAAQSAVARLDDRIVEARTRVANARSILARWVGTVANAPLGDAPSLARTHYTDEAPAHQLERHPDLGVLSSRQALAQAEADNARQDKGADWSASLMFSQRGPDYANMVSVGVSIPLQWDQKNRQDRELSARLAKVEQIRAERDELARAHLAQTQAWLASWQSNLTRLTHYDKILIVLARERTQAALAAYRGGQLPLTGVLEARRMEIDTQVERLRIEMQTAALWTSLEYILPDTSTSTHLITLEVTAQEHAK